MVTDAAPDINHELRVVKTAKAGLFRLTRE